MSATTGAQLAPLTTLRLGGPATSLITAQGESELIEAVRDADAAATPVLVLAGGSNVVIADEGFEGLALRVATRGLEPRQDAIVTIAAGEPWDGVVAWSVAQGLAGIECLAGIPGSAGATPLQNVGAYGQEVADTLVSLRALDRARGRVVELPAASLGLGYRTSALRGGDRHLVLDITLALQRTDLSQPIRYGELARALGVAPGERAPLRDVRAAVLALRRGKGMVIDPEDPDTVSAGSFFTNPIVPEDRLDPGAPRFPADRPGHVKTSAAWLIEQAGFARGHTEGRVGLSTKHTLALVNRGGASSAELLAFAHRIADAVQDRFGIALVPEPVLVGMEW